MIGLETMRARRRSSRDAGTSSEFHGHGIQNSGSGDFSARDIYIGKGTASDQLLADLRVTDPRDDKKRIEATKGGLLEDSYRWILDHRDFLQWRDDPQSRLLWIKGDPGKGKTMLLCGIINELNMTPPETPRPAFFFCQATDERLNSATAVLRGLLYMLISQHPNLVSYLQDKYKHAGKRLFEDVNAWFAMSQVLTSMLFDPALRGKVLVIDALDECMTDLQRLLDFISTASSHAKWIVSSRNWPTIEQTLNGTMARVRLCLELNADSTAAAVQTYIRYKVAELGRLKKYNAATRDAVQKHLIEHSNDTFLWVALVYQQLADSKVRKWHTLNVLKTFPPGLEPLYERMMSHISDSNDADLCKEILAIVSTVYRPVTSQELMCIIQSPAPFDDDLESLEEIIGCCGSFLTLRHGTVFFVHQSAKDFLLKQASGWILPCGIAHQHHSIFSRSIMVLSRTLRRDIYELSAPGALIEDISPPDPDPLIPLKYSCMHWVDHLRDSSPMENPTCRDMQDNGMVHTFLKDTLLYWLEALSLLRSMSQAVLSIHTLETLVQCEGTQQLAELVRDACRFVLCHRGAIEMAPLQLYTSALIFSPTHSSVRNLFIHGAPDWIVTTPAMDGKWNACLQTFEGHEDGVSSVAFSADGRRLASGSYDSTIRIWDSATGACVHTLKGHIDGVSSVAFSADGRRLASGSCDSTIRIWDSATGACVHTLRGHIDWVSSVVFQLKEQRLISSSYDEAVRTWEVTRGICVKTVEGHPRQFLSGAISAAISADGQRLASGSISDTAIHIRNTMTGACVQILEGHTCQVNSAAFSVDGRLLASGSDDGTIKVWDLATGACVQTLESHSCEVDSVAFSADGRQLASGSNDKTIKVWDLAAGTHVQTLDGHGGQVSLVTLSAGGQRLASAAMDDKTIKIWDSATGSCVQTLEGHSHGASSVAFSADSEQLASAPNIVETTTIHVVFEDKSATQSTYEGTADRTIKIWDLATGMCMQTLEGHDSQVNSVAFSADGRLLASGSSDRTIKIWDLATGMCVQTLESHSGSVDSVAFSADGQRLASGSSDRTVKVWDAATGACVQTLEVLRKANRLSFDSKTTTRLSSDIGVLTFGPSAADMPDASTVNPRYHGYGLSHDNVWIVKHTERLVWLPPEYRPSASAITGSTVALGCPSGRVLIMQFSRNDLDMEAVYGAAC